MSESLRAKIIRLAHNHPEFRKELLPLIAETERSASAHFAAGPKHTTKVLLEPYSTISYGLYAFEAALEKDPQLAADGILVDRVYSLKDALGDLNRYLESKYIWD